MAFLPLPPGVRRGGCVLAVALSFVPAAARAEFSASLHTRFRQSLAVEFDDARVQKLEVEAQPTLETVLPGGFQLTTVVRARVDTLDTIEPGRPDQSSYFPATERLLLGEPGELELRELYLERDFRRAFLTLGKQQVVWGKADGIKLLDLVNPQSFREFILPPFDESRIPLWTVNLEIPVSPVTAQLLWVPDTTVHDLPEDGAPFEIHSSVLVPSNPLNLPLRLEHADRPKSFFKDGDAGLRLSGSARGWDLTFNYLYHYLDVPVPRRSVSVGPEGLSIVVTPEYERTHVIGMSFGNSFGAFTLRGEAAAFTDRYVATNDVFDADGIVRGEEYSYVLGLDWFGLGAETFVSAQLLQSIVPGLPALAVREELESIATFLLRREFADSAGVAQTMLLMDVARGDGLARGRVGYQLSNHVTVAVGIDWFFGQNSGIFGQFDDRDRIVLEIEETL